MSEFEQNEIRKKDYGNKERYYSSKAIIRNDENQLNAKETKGTSLRI